MWIKKGLFIVAIICSFTISAKACDQCGCSVGGGINNLSAYATNNFILFRPAFSALHAYSETEAANIRTTLISYDVIAGYSVNKRLHITGYFPYKNYYYESGNGITEIKGIGDISLSANYILYNTPDSAQRQTTQMISVRGGVELPTGKFNSHFRTEHLPASLSAGSGSVDVIIGARYRVTKKNTMFLADYTFKYNTVNADAYQFGMQNTLALIVTQKLSSKKLVFTPYTGILAEQTSFDKFHELDMPATSGENIFVDFGVELVVRNIIMGASADIPLYSNFGNELSSSPRVGLQLGYLFN